MRGRARRYTVAPAAQLEPLGTTRHGRHGDRRLALGWSAQPDIVDGNLHPHREAQPQLQHVWSAGRNHDWLLEPHMPSHTNRYLCLCVEPKPLLAKAAHHILRSKTSLVATSTE